jgi:gliding motility-associated-like protein
MPIRSIVLPVLASTVLAAYGQRTTAFVENRGQWPEPVMFKADLPGTTVWCERDGLLIDRYDGAAIRHAHAGPDAPNPVVHHHAVRLRFLGANEEAKGEGLGVQRGSYNYFIGKDPRLWAQGAHAFNAVMRYGLYPGVDLRVRPASEGVKYDLLLAHGTDAGAITFTYEGADRADLVNGRIVVRTSLGTITEHIPSAYQEIDGARQEVACTYAHADGTFSFVLGTHDPELPVTIDPTLSFSTFSGSTSDNFGYTATYDQDGYLYSGSSAFGQGYPIVTGAYQTQHAGGQGLGDGIDVAITKFDTTGQFLLWSTFLGGAGDELPHSLIVNDANELFIYGTTSSLDLPTTGSAYDQSYNGGTTVNMSGVGANYVNGSDMFLARLSANGSALLASTYIGGSGNDGLNTGTGLKFNYADEIRGEVLLDENDNVFVASCTASSDFPTTGSPLQSAFGGGSHDAVIFKMDASLTTLFWSTFYGGASADAAYAIELDDAGRVYITGGTRSTNLAVGTAAYQPAFQGGNADAFVAEIAPDGSALMAATYYGSTAYDQAYFVDLDQEGRVYLFGQSSAPSGQLVFNAPYNIPNAGQIIAKFDPGLSTLLMASRFGQGDGIPDISPTAFLVDYCDKIYICGWGSNSTGLGGQLSTVGLPTTSDAFQPGTDNNDFYLAVFDINMTALFYGTYFGGGTSLEHVDGGTSRFDRRGRVYGAVCAGCGGNSDFPSTPNAWSASNNSSNCNLGVFKFDFNFPMVVADFNAEPVCLPAPVSFENESYGAVSCTWNFGDGGGSFSFQPTHTYTEPGIYTVTLIATNNAACNVADTMQRQLVVLGNDSYALPDTATCAGGSVQIGLLPVNDPDISFQWNPAQFLSSSVVPNPVCTPASTTQYTLLVSNGVCTDSISQLVTVQTSAIDAGPSVTVCGAGATTTLTANSFGTADHFQWSTNSGFTDTLNSDPTDSSITVTIQGDDTFFVRPLGNACGGYDSVFVNAELIAPLLTGDTLTCAEGVAELHVLGADPGSTFLWQPAAGINGQGTPDVQVGISATETFSVTVNSPGGCVWSDDITVYVSSIYGDSVGAFVDQPIVMAGTTVQLSATPTNGVNYAWSPGSEVSDAAIQNPTAFITQTTVFHVVITDGICTRSDSVIVTVYELNCEEPDIFIPDAFTPNSDGSNDILFVRGRFIARMELKIFDRWGELVFETTDPADGWDATYQGRPVDPAVFVYWLEVTCADGQEFFKKGNVTVIR